MSPVFPSPRLPPDSGTWLYTARERQWCCPVSQQDPQFCSWPQSDAYGVPLCSPHHFAALWQKTNEMKEKLESTAPLFMDCSLHNLWVPSWFFWWEWSQSSRVRQKNSLWIKLLNSDSAFFFWTTSYLGASLQSYLKSTTADLKCLNKVSMCARITGKACVGARRGTPSLSGVQLLLESVQLLLCGAQLLSGPLV